MTFLPIVERELRVAARRKGTTWTRFFAALTALVVGGVLLTANQRHLSAPSVGQQLFMAVSILAFGFALLAGIFLTADCLCSERRDGTLGLLFLTDLRGYAQSNTFGMAKFAAKFWSSISWLAGLAFGQLALASWLLPRSWPQGQVEKPSRTTRPARRISDLTNPFYWLANRDPFPGKLAWLGLAGLCVVWIGFFIGALAGRRNSADAALVTCMFMAFGMHTIVKGMMAVQASRRVSLDRRSGALELLLVTPLSIPSILEGHCRALRRQFRPLLWMLTLMNLLVVFVVVQFPARFHMPGDVVATFTTIFLGGIVLLFADYRAIGWVAMRLGVGGSRHHRAVLGTLARILLPPWLLIFLFIFLSLGSGAEPGVVLGFFIIWAIISLFVGQAQAQQAKEALTASLRRIAAGDAGSRALPSAQNAFVPAVSNWQK